MKCYFEFSVPKIFSSDCSIHWDYSDNQVHNLIRGLSPFPGAYTHLVQENGAKQMLKVFKTAKSDLPSKLNPGELQVSNGKLYVGTGSGALQILELQLEGKKRMPAADFLRGNNIERSILK